MNTVKDLFERLRTLYGVHQLERIARSYCMVDRQERKLRTRTVMALSVEVARIHEVNSFSTGLAAGLIEDVIEGNWKYVEESAKGFRFEDEPPEIGVDYAALWEDFVTIALGACAEAKGGGN